MDMEYPDIEVAPSSTSYFSDAQEGLDPRLFDGEHLRPAVRENLLTLLFHCLGLYFEYPHEWVRAWIAGSAASYQWDAARYPMDLDVLVGVNYPVFRSRNPQYRGLSDDEIAKMINEIMNSDLMPHTKDWRPPR